jgi:VWFA-related protein
MGRNFVQPECMLDVNPQESIVQSFRRSKMTRPLTIASLAALCSVGFMLGQTGTSAPARQANPAMPTTQVADLGPITTIRTYTNIVVIDVVVTDSQGNPVRGLKASDFSLMEDNKPQTLRHFEEHTAMPASSIKIEEAPKLPAGLFTNKPPAPVNGPANVLLLDYLNTPLTAQPYARKQLLDYLDKAPAGTRIAIFALTNHLVMLQGFTSDMKVLKAALTSKKGTPQASDILADSLNGGGVGNTVMSDAIANDAPAVEGMVTQQMVDSVHRFEALDASFQQDMIARITLDGFDMLARYLIGIPGRKNVIWFSGGFPLNVEPNVNEEDPNDSVVRNDDAVRRTENLLTRAQVAVYPVDARGLFTDPSLNFSNDDGQRVINGDSGQNAATAQMTGLVLTAQEHMTMEKMAEDTGGHAFYNTNGLTQAVQKAVENGSNYYTLTYSPSNPAWDSRFRAVKVKVDQPSVKLSYRNGYYALDPNDRSKLASQGAATALTQPTTMTTAMMHGGPDPAEIVFKVRIRPAPTPPEDTPIKNNKVNPGVKVNGPFREYSVDLVPDPRAVNCRQEPSGNRHCALEVWTFVYNTEGVRLITAVNHLYRYLTPADYAQLLKGGMAFHQEICVPVKGQYYVRTAIHDVVSDRVGAVEIPVLEVARLDPLQPLPDQPASALQMNSPTAQPPAAAVPDVKTPDAASAPK